MRCGISKSCVHQKDREKREKCIFGEGLIIVLHRKLLVFMFLEKQIGNITTKNRQGSVLICEKLFPLKSCLWCWY